MFWWTRLGLVNVDHPAILKIHLTTTHPSVYPAKHANMSSADGVSSNSSSSGSSPSTLHQATSNGNSGGRSPSSKPRPGRPAKKIATLCGWCEEPSSGKQPMLKYVWEQEKKEFCSKSCIAQFKEAHSRGFCVQCDNVLGLAAPHKEFCSMYCLNKYQRANAAPGSGGDNQSGAGSPNGASPTVGVAQSSPNNNNHHVNNNNSSSAPSARSFQYESFHVFNWDDYLKVSSSIFDCLYSMYISFILQYFLKFESQNYLFLVLHTLL